MIRGLFLAVVIWGFGSWTHAAEEEFRTWIDKTGKFKITARIVSYENGQVTLTKKDGKNVVLPVLKLSKVDREYVYKFHNPEYGKRREPKKSEDEEETEESEGEGSEEEATEETPRRGRGRDRGRRPGSRVPPPKTDEEDDSASSDSDAGDSKASPPEPGQLLDAAKKLFGINPLGASTSPAGIPGEASGTTTIAPTIPLETGPVAVTASARWTETPVVIDGEERRPLELVLNLSGGPAGAAVAYGKLKLTSFLDQDNKGVDLFVNSLTGDPAKEFVRIEPKVSTPDPNSGIGPPPTQAPPQYPGSNPQSTAQQIVLYVNVTSDTALIAEFVGSLTLKAGGQRSQIVVPNVASTTGDVPLPGADALGLQAKMDHPNPKTVKLTLSGNVDGVIHVGLADGTGKPLAPVSRSSVDTAGTRTVTWTLAGDVPPDCQLQLDTATGLQEFEVPFEISDVLVPDSK